MSSSQAFGAANFAMGSRGFAASNADALFLESLFPAFAASFRFVYTGLATCLLFNRLHISASAAKTLLFETFGSFLSRAIDDLKAFCAAYMWKFRWARATVDAKVSSLKIITLSLVETHVGSPVGCLV